MSMTPDPREEKLPLWVRDTLLALRRQVRDAEQIADAVRGVHTGSNVQIVGSGTRKDNIPLPKNSHVQFDSKWGSVQIGHDLDGRVRVQGDSVLIVRLNAGNALTVELEGVA